MTIDQLGIGAPGRTIYPNRVAYADAVLVVFVETLPGT